MSLYYRSHSNGKLYPFKPFHSTEGVIGSVGELEDRPDFVYKKVLLTPKETDFSAKGGRDWRIKGLNRELWALKKLNRLEGYIHQDDAVILIMRRGEKNPSDTFTSFKALIELNDQDIYHGIDHINPSAEKEMGYGLASDFSLFNKLGQIRVFSSSIENKNNALANGLISIQKKAEDQHNKAQNKLKYYAKIGFTLISCIGVVSVWGGLFNSLLLRQLIASSFARFLVNELNSILDEFDNIYIRYKDKDKDKDTNKSKRIFSRILKTVVNLGYILINFYTLRNLYLNVPNLQIISNLSKCIETIAKCENGMSQLIRNGVYQSIIPTLKGLSQLIKNNGVAQLDQPLAEIAYLYIRIGSASRSLARMFEKLPPVDCLLMQMDLTYQYNPKLLFTYAKNKVKEKLYGPEEEILTTKNKIKINN